MDSRTVKWGDSTPDAYGDGELLLGELISIFVIDWLITLLTLSTSRYLLIGFVPLVIAMGIQYSRSNMSRIFDGLWIALLILLNVFIQREAYNAVTGHEGYDKDICLQMVQEARDNDCDLIVVYNNVQWSEMLRVYSPDYPIVTYQPYYDALGDRDCENILDTSDMQEGCLLLVPEGSQDEWFDAMIERYGFQGYGNIGLPAYRN